MLPEHHHRGSDFLTPGLQAVLVRISARLLKKTLTHTDERAKVEGELLDGMDVVKCMTWEVSFYHSPA